MFVAGRIIAAGDLEIAGQTFPRLTEGHRDGYVAALDAEGRVLHVWFYNSGPFPSRCRLWAVAANDSEQLAVAGQIIGTVRAPTGEMLYAPCSNDFDTTGWDGILTVISALKQ